MTTTQTKYGVGDVLTATRVRGGTSGNVDELAHEPGQGNASRFVVVEAVIGEASAHNDRWTYVRYTLAAYPTQGNGTFDIDSAQTFQVNDDRIDNDIPVMHGAVEVTKTITFGLTPTTKARYVVRESSGLGWDLIDTGLDCTVGNYDTEGDAQTTANLLNERDATL